MIFKPSLSLGIPLHRRPATVAPDADPWDIFLEGIPRLICKRCS
jgi:hypothetical protein